MGLVPCCDDLWGISHRVVLSLLLRCVSIHAQFCPIVIMLCCPPQARETVEGLGSVPFSATAAMGSHLGTILPLGKYLMMESSVCSRDQCIGAVG